MKQKLLLKPLSLFLALLITFSIFPVANAHSVAQEIPADYIPGQETIEDLGAQVFIKEKDKAQLQDELACMVYEIKSLREENVKHFKLEDGTYQAVVYGQPVHRLNSDGEWEDIDNHLSIISDNISTSNSRVKFAKKITGNENIFTLHEDNYKVTFGLVGATKKVEGIYVNTETNFDESASKLQKLTTLDNLSASVVYKDILPGVDLEYILESNDIKENIIVKEFCDAYSYTFTIKLNSLEASLDNNSVIISDDSTGEEIYRIPTPYMYDALGEMSQDVYYTLTEVGNGKYELTITANEQWINSSTREFPVVIDPSLVDIAQAADTYVSYSEPAKNYGSATDLWVSDYHVAYYKFTTPTLPNGVTVSYASVKIPYYYFVTNEKYMSMGIYQVTSSWSEHSVTWNTKPTTASSAIATANIYADGVNELNPKYVTYSVSSYVQSWYNGTQNHGFALKRTGGTNASILLVSREKIKKYAQLTINYVGEGLGQGVYAVSNAGTNKYLKSYINQDLSWLLQDTSHTSAPVASTNLENLFKISYRPGYDDYIIRSMIDNSLIIYPSVENNAPIASRMSTSDEDLTKNYGWKLISVGSYYHIACTRAGITYYAKSVSDNDEAAIKFTTNPNEEGTKWHFTHYTGNAIETVATEKFISAIRVEDTYQYRVRMRSTRINHNGPVQYSVTDTDGSQTDKATINASSGILIAHKVGTIHLCITYPGAPWIWYWKISIATENGWIQVNAPTIESREDWGARDVIESRLVDRTRAPERIIFHHSAEKFSSTDINSVKAEIRRIQNDHMNDEGKCDIAYHFIIDPAGRIWKGAEVDTYQRGHTGNYFDDIGVLVLGDFESRLLNLWSPNVLNQEQKAAMETLAKWLCYEYNLCMIDTGDALAPINTHRTLNNTVCPGENMAPWVENELRAIINNWNVGENE